jgi:hypothetical protein
VKGVIIVIIIIIKLIVIKIINIKEITKVNPSFDFGDFLRNDSKEYKNL